MNDSLDFLSNLILNQDFREKYLKEVYDSNQKIIESALLSFLEKNGYYFARGKNVNSFLNQLLKIKYEDLATESYTLDDLDDKLLGKLGLEPSW